MMLFIKDKHSFIIPSHLKTSNEKDPRISYSFRTQETNETKNHKFFHLKIKIFQTNL